MMGREDARNMQSFTTEQIWLLVRLVGYLKDNSVNDSIKVYSYIVLSATCFGSSYEPSSGRLLFFTNSQYVSTILSLMAYNKN